MLNVDCSHLCLRGVNLEHKKLIWVTQVQNKSRGKLDLEVIEGASSVHWSELGFPFKRALRGAATEMKLHMKLQ